MSSESLLDGDLVPGGAFIAGGRDRYPDDEELLSTEPPAGTRDSAGLVEGAVEETLVAPYNVVECTREVVEAHTEYPADTGPVTAGDLSEGDRGPTRILSGLKRTDFVRYAGASGDFNPIHYDPPYAVGAGNPSVFGQGMLVSGFVSTVLAEWCGVASSERFATRFENRIWPGDTVEVTSTVDSLEESDGKTAAEIVLTAENDDGDTLVTATADVELPREG
jgi:acyl dehydratase